MPPTPRLVWTSTGNLKSPNRQHKDVTCMLRWGFGLDIRTNTVRYVLDYGERGNRLSEEQKSKIKEELEVQIQLTFHRRKKPLPLVCFPSGQQFDSRMVDFYCSPKGEVTVRELEYEAKNFTHLGGTRLTYKRNYTSNIERNEQLLRINNLPAGLLDAFVEDREALLRDVSGPDARIKDIWALEWYGSFSGQVDVLIALPDEEDAITAAHDWPGWLLWNDQLLELTYRNRFAYCSYCQNSGASERHVRKHCKIAPPTDEEDLEELEDDDGRFVYSDKHQRVWIDGNWGWRPSGDDHSWPPLVL